MMVFSFEYMLIDLLLYFQSMFHGINQGSLRNISYSWTIAIPINFLDGTK